jgi:hypothetical protein
MLRAYFPVRTIPNRGGKESTCVILTISSLQPFSGKKDVEKKKRKHGSIPSFRAGEKRGMAPFFTERKFRRVDADSCAILSKGAANTTHSAGRIAFRFCSFSYYFSTLKRFQIFMIISSFSKIDACIWTFLEIFSSF